MSKDLPILKLRMDGLGQSIVAAFTDANLSEDKMVQDAISKFCREDNLRQLIEQEVNTALSEAIKSAIKSATSTWMYGGPGRELIETQVKKRLNEWAEIYKARGD